MTPPPTSHRAGSKQESRTPRAKGVWLWTTELVAIVLLYIVAVEARLSLLDGACVAGDWPVTIRLAQEFAFGLSPTLSPQILYTSWPTLVLGRFVALFQEPERVLFAWLLLEATTAPILFVVVRRTAGLLAGVLAALVIVWSNGDIELALGLRSPYFITALVGLAGLGLWAATHRKTWGVPVLVLGLAGATVLHLGLWLMSVVGVVLCGVHLFRLPWRRALVALAGALAVGGEICWVVWRLDGPRLSREISLNTGGRFALHMEDNNPAVLFRHVCVGFDIEPRLLLWFIGVGVLCSLSLVVAHGVHFRKGIRPVSLAWRMHRRTAAVGLQAGMLLLAASYPYVRLGVQTGHLSSFHFVAMVPLLVLALAGLLGALGFHRWPWLGWGLAAIPLACWICLPFPGAPAPACTPGELGSLGGVSELSDVVRERAQERQHRPEVIGYEAGTLPIGLEIVVAVVDELARWGWRSESLPTDCYLVTRPSRAATLPELEMLHQRPELAVYFDPDCAAVRVSGDLLCSGQEWSSLVGGARSLNKDVDELLPCIHRF